MNKPKIKLTTYLDAIYHTPPPYIAIYILTLLGLGIIKIQNTFVSGDSQITKDLYFTYS